MQAMNAAPYQIAFVSFDDNNDIIIRHDFCIIPPPLLLGECKDNITKFEYLVSHKIVGSVGSVSSGFSSGSSHSARGGSRLQPEVKTGANKAPASRR